MIPLIHEAACFRIFSWATKAATYISHEFSSNSNALVYAYCRFKCFSCVEVVWSEIPDIFNFFLNICIYPFFFFLGRNFLWFFINNKNTSYFEIDMSSFMTIIWFTEDSNFIVSIFIFLIFLVSQPENIIPNY